MTAQCESCGTICQWRHMIPFRCKMWTPKTEGKGREDMSKKHEENFLKYADSKQEACASVEAVLERLNNQVEKALIYYFKVGLSDCIEDISGIFRTELEAMEARHRDDLEGVLRRITRAMELGAAHGIAGLKAAHEIAKIAKERGITI